LGNEQSGERHYITVRELSVGFGENIMPPARSLVGKKIELHCESGRKAKITFTHPAVLAWETIDGSNKSLASACPYTAVQPREGFLFVDFTVPGDDRSVSIVLDMKRACATFVTGLMPTAEALMIPMIVRAEERMALTPVQVSFEHAAVDIPFSEATPRHEKTTDLVGERVQWVYSSKDAYEHIYLNENTYSWHCIAGNEKGLADTDRCFCYRIEEEFYLFVWIEKIIPTLGVVLEDFAVMRSCGKIFGREGYGTGGRVVNFPVGSYGTRLNRTEYDFSRLSGPEGEDT
jgi:hypothetical protein